jgi:hypothetical protein
MRSQDNDLLRMPLQINIVVFWKLQGLRGIVPLFSTSTSFAKTHEAAGYKGECNRCPATRDDIIRLPA